MRYIKLHNIVSNICGKNITATRKNLSEHGIVGKGEEFQEFM